MDLSSTARGRRATLKVVPGSIITSSAYAKPPGAYRETGGTVTADRGRSDPRLARAASGSGDLITQWVLCYSTQPGTGTHLRS